MEKKEINQKQSHQQGSSSHAGKKASKKKPHNSALHCRTNSNLATKTCKARGKKGIGTLRRMLKKTVVENMEAKTVEMRRDREGIMQVVATAEEIKLELDLLKISIYQHSHDMLRTSEAVDKLAEIMLLQLD
ncbi:hypothetical protein SLA2020_479310 [Shorea laevis]